MLAIFKREIKSLFNNVIGWLFVGITLALFGLYFFVYNLSYGHPYISYSLSAISIMFMITVPILTMRVMAEEKRSKTDQLLFTSPISMKKIVFAKYLAVGAVYSICVLVICIAPIVLRVFGEVPLLETYVGILGFWLYGLACIAIGVFASSLTESQVIAAVVSFALLFLGYMMDVLCGVLSPSGNVVTKILCCYNLYAPLGEFFGGVLPLKDILYYLSIIFLALFFAYEVLQKKRWSVSKNKITTSVYSVGTIVLCIALVVVANFGVSKIPAKFTDFDVSSKKLYSITKETKEYLSKLKDDITIYVYVDKKSKDENVDKTLSKYAEASKHIKVKYINPASNPKFAEKYTTDGNLNTNSIVVVCGERSKIIDYGSSENSLIDSQIYEYTMDATTYSYVPSKYDCEGQVTSAIAYVTSENNTVVYVLTGHEEHAFTKSFTEVLDKQFITVKTLDLLQADSVPKDCEALFINGPESDFSKDDLDKIKSYINKKGAVFISLNYNHYDSMERFRAFLEEYHISTSESVVMENDSAYYYQYPFQLLPRVEDLDMTAGIAGNSSVLAPYLIGLQYTQEDGGDGKDACLNFLSSSKDCFAKSSENVSKDRSDSEADKLVTKEEGDSDGPFSCGMIVLPEQGGKLAVVGSTYLFTEEANQMVAGRNAKLFQGIVSSLVSTKEAEKSAVVIPAKDYSVSAILVSQRMILVYGVLWGILMPLSSIVVGIVIWAKRRKK